MQVFSILLSSKKCTLKTVPTEGAGTKSMSSHQTSPKARATVCELSSNECSEGFLHMCSYKGVIICDYTLSVLPVFFQLLLTPDVCLMVQLTSIVPVLSSINLLLKC